MYQYFLLSGPSKGEDIPPELIKPVCNLFCFWSKRLQTLLWCGVRHDSSEVRAWAHQLCPTRAWEQWVHMHACTGGQGPRREQTVFQQSLSKVTQGMVHRHQRLEMRRAKPSRSALVS